MPCGMGLAAAGMDPARARPACERTDGGPTIAHGFEEAFGGGGGGHVPPPWALLAGLAPRGGVFGGGGGGFFGFGCTTACRWAPLPELSRAPSSTAGGGGLSAPALGGRFGGGGGGQDWAAGGGGGLAGKACLRSGALSVGTRLQSLPRGQAQAARAGTGCARLQGWPIHSSSSAVGAYTAFLVPNIISRFWQNGPWAVRPRIIPV